MAPACHDAPCRCTRCRCRRLLLSALFCVPMSAAQDVADTTAPRQRDRQAQEAEQRLQQLRDELATLKQALTRGQQEESGAVAALADAERSVSSHRQALASLDERRAGHEAERARLDAEQTRVQAQVAIQQSALSALLRLNYARSRQAPAKLLLDPERAPKLARALGYARVLQDARLARIRDYADSLAELAGLAEAELAALAALEQIRLDAERSEQALTAAVREREKALSSLRLQLGDQRQRMAKLGRDEQGLVRLLSQLRDIFADLPSVLDGAQPFRSLRGRLIWPVAGSATSDPQGGLLIHAEAGLPVRVVGHGRVAFADWLKGYGLLLIVDHGEGYMSLYGHNESLLKAEGAWVETGEEIARVGQSGGETRAGLYFELRERGRRIDPRPWLARR